MNKLFESYELAGLALKNRVVMAPMTRARAKDDIPDDQTVLYYKQRASAGLIVSEGVPISIEGRGYLFNPGLYTNEQAAAWRRVTDAVHAEGGRIFAQLWHVGRMSHVSLQPDGGAPVSSVAVQAAKSKAYAWAEPGVPGLVQASEPRALHIADIHRITEEFVAAAKKAVIAGFDGVELHGANGYLFEQFLNGALNTRNDAYGSSIEGRQRFILETLDALVAEIGKERVGVRLSPFGRLFDMHPFSGEQDTWLTLAKELNRRELAYVHLSDQLTIGAEAIPEGFAQKFRAAYDGTLIVAGGFTARTADVALETGDLDLVAFGRPFIANPDLVHRMKNNLALTPIDTSVFYGVQATKDKGYTDYPAFQVTSD